MRTDAERTIAHLYRRAGFGLSPAELRAAAARGFRACVEDLLHPEKDDDPLAAALERLEGEVFDLTNLEDAQAWWIYRILHTARPLEEKMTLFWHGHFATGAGKVEDVGLMVRQNELFRAHALGRFADLLAAVARDPAMLLFLDGARSTKGKPNENFPRELLELFTLGRGGYAETDIRELARLFTGWKVREGEAAFEPKDHDGSPKTLFGETRPWKPEEVVERLAEDPATARRLAGKIVRFFVADEGLPELETEVARKFLDADGDMRETLRAVFLSPHFVSARALRAKIKGPVEFVVGAIRELGVAVPVRRLPGPTARMGQALFNPPTVKGWDGGLAWVNTATLFERANFANTLVTYRARKTDGRPFEPEAWVGRDADAAKVVSTFLDALLDGEAPPGTRAALEGYLQMKGEKGILGPFRPTKAGLDGKVRGLVRLILSSPEYQLA
ncbi:MAG TPA: DUF1800 domain-containing protein [Planctomycetota bacterium]|nr:DUF1800 domain-containing protein [Planctomycetota bacterium]